MNFPNACLMIGLLSVGTLAFDQLSLARMHDQGCPAGMSARDWTKESVQTLEGRIKDVIVDKECMGRIGFMSLQVTVDGKDHLVRLGPVTYVNSKKIGIALGEMIRLKGVTVANGSEAYFVASELEIKGKKVKLRDEDGRPVWAGRHRGGVS